MFNSAGLISRRVRDSLILAMRQAFAAHPRYPYLETGSGEFDFDNSKVFISDVTPIESVAYPMIVVNTLSGPESRYLGPDLLQDTYDNLGNVVSTTNFTSFQLTASITVYTRDTIVRDELMDSIYDTLKEKKDQLATDHVEIVQTELLPESREFLYDRWWYKSNITMHLYTEWSTITSGIQSVGSVALTNVFTGSSTSEF